MAIGSLAVALAIFSVAYLPTNDGPQHVLSGHLQKAFSEPGTPYSDVLEPLPGFAERGFSTLFVPLLELFSWRVALSITLVVIALSGAWSFAGLCCALAKRRTPWALLGLALAFPWTFYMGFLPFVLGANIGLGIVAYAIAREAPRRRELVILYSMLLVDAVMHVGDAATTGLLVLLVLSARADAGRRLRAVGVVALVGLPAFAVLAGVLLSSSHVDGAREPWVWTPRMEWLVELPRYVVPGPMPRALAGCLLVVLGLYVGIRRARRRESSRAELAVLAAALLFIACALVGPLDVPGWQLVAPRFASLGVPLAIALLAPVWPTRSPRIVLAGIVALTALSLGITFQLHHRLSRGCEPALAGLSSNVDLAGVTLPLPLDAYCGVSSDPRASEVPHLAPLFHVGALYAVARGGFTPYMFGGASAIHAFRYRSDLRGKDVVPPSPPSRLYLALAGRETRFDRARREYLVARFAEYGMTHQHLLVVGAREGELGDILARGYAADWQSDSAMIAHPRACTIDVLVRAEDDPHGVRIEIGQRPAGDPVVAMTADRGDALPDGARRLRFVGAGCGPLWVRGFSDADGSGTASKGDVFCAGAGGDGSLEVNLGTQGEVQCRIDRRAHVTPP
jgi:hypothetical protein